MSNAKATVQLRTEKCKACWKCMDKCLEKVIGKINIIIHKHVVLKHPDKCIGCLKCVKICPHGAFSSNIPT